MDLQETYNQIQRLPAMAGAIRRREPSAIKFLQELYRHVTGTTVYANCDGCHIKAANKLMSLSYENLLTMSEQKFKLKKGVSIEFPFRSGQRLTAANINDAKAAEYLYNVPTGVAFFEEFPNDGNGGVDLEQWYPSEEAIPELSAEEIAAEEAKKAEEAAKKEAAKKAAFEAKEAEKIAKKEAADKAKAEAKAAKEAAKASKQA